jgi:glycosyltransferase involved in cell wall biosynthesis
MSLIRVGLSTTTTEPVLTGGRADGIGVYTSALLKRLPDTTCEVHGYAYPPLMRPLLGKQFSVSKPMLQPYLALSVQDLLSPKHFVAMPVDVFHVTDYRIVRMNCPIVATLHDAIPQKYPEWSSPRLRSLKNWLQRKAAQRADHVIALSNYAVSELVECFGVDERRITVVPCGVDTDWNESPDAAAVDETLSLHGLRPGYFMFVGTFQPRKNIARIIEAYLGLPKKIRDERQLVLVGRPGWHSQTVLKMIAAARENGENVVWLNDLRNNEQLRHLYAGAGVFVFPSLYEGFGIPVTEAFASGVPVVTSNTTSLPEVSEGAALEVNPMLVEEIRNAMLLLSQDEALRSRCIRAGQKRAEQLTWQRTARETCSVYKKVLG